MKALGAIARLAAVFRPRTAPAPAALGSAPARPVELRVDAELWRRVRGQIDDPDNEQAGVLLLRPAGPSLVVAVGWVPVEEEYVTSRDHGLDYDGRFHLVAARAAAAAGAGMLLAHTHAGPDPEPSERDRERGEAFLGFAARRLPDVPHGLAVIGDGAAAAVLADGRGLPIGSIRVVGARRVVLPAHPWDKQAPRRPLPAAGPPTQAGAPGDGPDRQELVFGAAGTTALRRATVAVVGLSGGGSHVFQQLVHAGVGTLVAVDDDTVQRSNLRRLVTAVDTDAGTTHKTDLPTRLATALHGGRTRVVPVRTVFPSPESVDALRAADIIVGCVDGWDGRDDLNSFALEHRIPYVDIGAVIPAGGASPRISGQVAIVLPDGPCLRCTGLVDDDRVAAARLRRQGYLEGEPEPQVVSVNGVLASEAVTAVLLLLATEDAPIEALRSYRYPPGKLVPVDASRRPGCPACGAAGLLS